jgi:hypothetical protein
MSRRSLTKFEQELLNSPECLLWPDCACHNNLAHWQGALQDGRTFDNEQIEAAEEVIFYTCACVAEHCPDPTIKAYGKRQWARLTQRRHRIAQPQREARAN